MTEYKWDIIMIYIAFSILMHASRRIKGYAWKRNIEDVVKLVVA